MATIHPLRTSEDLERIWERSQERPVWVFKHSLTCSISSRAYAAYREYAEAESAASPELTLLEIQRSRELSGEIARKTGVRHESPQAILLRGGEAVWDASHGAITASALAGAVRELETAPDAADPR